MRVTWFPFDSQVCHMLFLSWAYDGTAVDLHPEMSIDASTHKWVCVIYAMLFYQNLLTNWSALTREAQTSQAEGVWNGFMACSCFPLF